MIDLSAQTDAQRLDLLEQAFSSVDEVCSLLSDQDWDRATDLPAWTVKDNLAHLAHYESTAAGLPQPEARPIDHLDYAQNEFQRGNELGVEARRPLPGRQVLEEFRSASTLRLKELRELDDEGWGANAKTPLGEFPMRNFMPIRILDVFYHEQDIRRAVEKPGHLDGDVARFVFARWATVALPRVIAKEAGTPDGSTIAFDVSAPGESFAIAVQDGKGNVVAAPADPTVRFTADFEAFMLLIGGRRTPEELGARLKVEGDQAIANKILEHIVVVP